MEVPRDQAKRLRRLREEGDAQWKDMCVALRLEGHMPAAIARAAGVSRQRVHAITSDPRRRPPVLTSEAAELLAAMWDLSASRRGSTPDTSPAAQGHTLLVGAVTELVRSGVRFDALADGIGVDRTTFRSRMLRAGVTREKIVGHTTGQTG